MSSNPASSSKIVKHKSKRAKSCNATSDEELGTAQKSKRKHTHSRSATNSNKKERASDGNITTFFQRMSGDNKQDKDGRTIADTNNASICNSSSSSEKPKTKKDKIKKIKRHSKSAERSSHPTKSEDAKPARTSKKYKNKKHKKIQEVQSDESLDSYVDNQNLTKTKNYKDLTESDVCKNKATMSPIEVTSVELNPPKPLINAFSFMMDNRHKVIGHNSPGREGGSADEPSNLEKEKEKLTARKALFQKWADSKGAKKRKMEDEELGITIDYKLKQRSKRMKKMLTQVNEHSGKSNKRTNHSKSCKKSENITVVKKTHDDDDDNDFVIKCKGISTTYVVSDKSNNEIKIIAEYKERLDNKKSLNQTDLSGFFGILDKSKSAINNSTGELKPDRLNENEIPIFTPKTKNKWKMRLRVSLDALDDETFETLIGGHGSSKKHPKNNKTILKPINGNSTIYTDSNNSKLHNHTKHTTHFEQENKEKQLEDLLTKSKVKRRSVMEAKSDLDCEDVNKQRNRKMNRECNKKLNSDVKIAPVFLNAVPRPKVDKQVLLARKTFLESGIPDELKKFRDKQQKLLNRTYPIFPSISHVTVSPSEDQENYPLNFWRLPCVELNLRTDTTFVPDIPKLKLGMLTNSAPVEIFRNSFHDLEKVSNIKEELQKIKEENRTYPVHKSFRFFNTACSNIEQDSRKKSKKSKKRHSKYKDESKSKVTPYKLWTDLYKPSSCDEMFSNHSNVKSIKKWLQSWLDFSLTTNRKRQKSGSSSDFEYTDVDSRDSSDMPRNTMILTGPHGSGKTSAVHALCRELSIIVLESNASSKRTGKMLLQQLQQISQSHELQGVVDDFLANEIKATPKRMHLLLIEDVDVVFEQDESFTSAVNQLITTSRLPIILTTTDLNCLHLKKIISLHTVKSFTSVSPKVLAPWLQILCLVQGVCIKKHVVSELLQDCNGDVRCTLLQLQFLLQSEASPINNKSILSNISHYDESNISEIAKDVNDTEVFADVVLGKTCDIVKPLDLGELWWNIPQLLNMPSPLLYHENDNEKVELDQNIETVPLQNITDSNVLLHISDVFNAFAMTDRFYSNIVDCDLEPVHKNRSLMLKRSLEETISEDGCFFNRDLTVEMSHALLDGCITSRGAFSNLNTYRAINEKRWRAKQYKCNEEFLAAVPLIHQLDRTAVTDFLSTLRTIAKSESGRATVNNKRNNRFYNYLTGLGIHSNDSILKTVNNAFFSDT